MLRDITLGQYYPGNSVIHRLDPRVKIIGTMVYIVALFVVHTFVGFAISFVALAAVIAVSKVPVKFILRGLKPIFFIILFTFVLNMRTLGKNIAFLIKSIALGKEEFGLPEQEAWVATNFIR